MKKKVLIVLLAILIVASPLQGVFALDKSIEAINDLGTISNNETSVDIKYGTEDAKVYFGESGISIVTKDQSVTLDTNFSVLKLIAVDDINGDGFVDFLTYQDVPEYNDQIYLVSGSDGSVLSSLRLTRTGYTESIGVTDVNCYVQQLLDYDGKTALIVYDYNIAVVDVASCTVSGSYTDTDNIWKVVKLDDGIVAFTCQDNAVGFFDVESGQLISRFTLTEEYHVSMPWNENYSDEAVMNAWDIAVYGEDIYVTTEDGYLFKVSEEGIIDRYDISSVDRETFISRLYENLSWYNAGFKYIQTGITSWAYMSYRIADITDDYILLNCYMGDKDSLTSMDWSSTAAVILIDRSNGEIIFKTALDSFNMMYEKNCIGEYEGVPCITVIQNESEGHLRVVAYSLEGSILYQGDLALAIVKDNDRIELTWEDDHYVLEVFNKGCSDVSADLKSSVYRYDSITTSLIDYDAEYILISYNFNGEKKTLAKYDDTLQNIIWEYHVDDSFSNRGFEFIRADIDYNNDGVRDILGIVNNYNEKNENKGSYFIVINGVDGKTIISNRCKTGEITENKKKVPLYLTAEKLDITKDIDKDGKYELVADGQVIATKKFTLIGSLDSYVPAEGQQFAVGDINGDGINDVAVVSDKETRLYLSKMTYSYGFLFVEYTKTKTVISNNSKYEPIYTTVLLGDIDNDGVCELGMIDYNASGYEVYKVVNGATLKTMFYLCEDGINDDGEAFSVLNFDLNGDGYNELWGRDAWHYGIYDGKTGAFLVNVDPYNYGDDYYWYDESGDYHPDYNVPFYDLSYDDSRSFIATEDITGDGLPELALLRQEYDDSWDMVYYLHVIGSGDFEEISSFYIGSAQTYNGGYYEYVSYSIKEVKDGDGLIALASEEKTTVFDMESQSVIATLKVAADEVFGFDKKTLLITDTNKSLYRVNIDKSFELNVQIPEFTDDYILHLDWTPLQEYSIMTIYDNSKVAFTGADTSADIRLLQGEHEIILSMDDGQGKSYQQTYRVNVSAPDKSPLMPVAVSAVFVALGVFFGVWQKQRIRKKFISKEAGK